ncbi:MAG: ANTAR domain-containing protein [Nitriliruptorales bacterium]|nr:ANTAR domain-containing protein [Nitriliruptorales bacterium]
MDGVVNVLGVWGAGVSLADDKGQLRFVSATDDVVERLQALEDDVDRGPCREAYDSGFPVVVGDLQALADRWPRLVNQATAAGVNAVMGVPMSVDGEAIGALNVYEKRSGDFSDEQVAAAQVLADVATGYIVNVRDLGRATELAAQLQHALDSRVLIEQAKGFLSATLGLDVDMAFELLRTYSRSNRINIHDVAAGVIDGTLQVHEGALRGADERDLTP